MSPESQLFSVEGEQVLANPYRTPRILDSRGPAISLISIRPPYAGSVLRGAKTVELRTRAPRFAPGDILIVYEAAPTMAVRGAVEVLGIETGTPAQIRRRFLTEARVSREAFDAYFSGREQAVAIHLGGVFEFSSALTLLELRRAAPTFRPPQTWVSLGTLPLPVQSRLLRLVRGWGVRGAVGIER